MSRHNNTVEKIETSLSRIDQVKLIQDAMGTKLNRNFKEWGHDALGELLNCNATDGASPDGYMLFLAQLLLFISDADRAADFKEEVWNGRQFIRQLISFFDGLQMPNMYSEYADYYNVARGDLKDFELVAYARKYLADENLRQVLTAYGKTE